MIELYKKDELIGTLSEAELQFLIDQLEEEYSDDQDYAITPMTIAFLEEQGADPKLLAMLKRALGERQEVIIRWQRV